MPEFRLVANVTINAFTTVEADTLEDAIKQAAGRPVEHGQYGSYSRREHWLVFDLDGSVANIAQDDE